MGIVEQYHLTPRDQTLVAGKQSLSTATQRNIKRVSGTCKEDLCPCDVKQMKGWPRRGHFLSGAVQGCAAGIGTLFMPEII